MGQGNYSLIWPKMKSNDLLVVKVKGNSMWPFLRDGDIVVVKSMSLEEISLGEIVLAEKNSVFFCHRLFRKKEGYFQTKADTFLGLDPKLKRVNLLGKVIAKKRKGKFVRIDRKINKCLGIVILWVSLLLSPLYVILRFLRRLILRYAFRERLS